MFWGLIMEPYKRYSQTVQHTFHLSMACLDVTKADDGVIQVMLFYEGKNYLLCNLNKESKWQVPLDITLEENSEIAFACNGNGAVHLTGYLLSSSDDDFEEIVADNHDKKSKEDKLDMLNDHNSKRKAKDSPKSQKQAKRLKQHLMEDTSDDDDEDDDLDDESEDDTEDSEDVMEEEQEDDSDEDEEDEDDEDDKKLQQIKKTMKQQQEKKGKQSQEQQQQQKKKQDKQKVINGKEIRQEQQSKQQKKNKAEQQTQQRQNVQSEAKKRVIEGGVQIEELRAGHGAFAKPGKTVSMYYIGRLKNGKKFDATMQGDGFTFRLGKGEVIRGWDVGIAGMKVGEKRRIVIPPSMGYGAKGSLPAIPGNSTLIFDVELKKVH